MALKTGNRVRETTSTSGTGTLSLGGTVTGYQTFVNGIGNGNTCAYLIDDGNGNWEITWGTVTSGTPATLSRGTLIASSTGSRISFAATTKTVAVVPAGELLLWSADSAVLVETDIASATTTDLGTVATLRARITGTTTITSLGSQPNALRWIRFAASLTLTHNGTSLITPTAANIQTAAGDIALVASDASGNWRVLYYQCAGAALESAAGPISVSTSGTNITSLSITPGKWRLSATAYFSGNGATNGYSEIAIGTTTGSVSTGTTLGKSRSVFANNLAAGLGGGAIAPFDVTITSTTTYYLIGKMVGGSDNMYGYFRAERII